MSEFDAFRDDLTAIEEQAAWALMGYEPPTATPADGFLYLIAAEASLLDPAPVGYTSKDMDARKATGRPCLRCAKRAPEIHVCAIVADTKIGPRWVDLCMACVNWLQNGATPPPITAPRGGSTS